MAVFFLTNELPPAAAIASRGAGFLWHRYAAAPGLVSVLPP
jgi:hypothetical protein